MSVDRAYVDCSIATGETLQIHYRQAGSPSKPPLLLLHQSPSSSLMYESLMQLLSDHFFLLAPDTPGFGNSDALPGNDDLDVADYACVVNSFLKAKGIKQCFVFGHHTGASIAVQLEHDYPATAIAMSLSGPTLLTDEQKQVLPSMASPFQLQQDGSHLVGMWQRMKTKEPDADLDLIQREVLLGFSSGESYQAAYTAVTKQDFAKQLEKISCPVQVFAGDEDPLYGSVAPSLDLLLHGQQASLESGARTYVCDRRPAEVAELLRVFFTKLTKQKSN